MLGVHNEAQNGSPYRGGVWPAKIANTLVKKGVTSTQKLWELCGESAKELLHFLA